MYAKIQKFTIARNLVCTGGRAIAKSFSSRNMATAGAATVAHQNLISVGSKIIAVGRNYAAHAKELGNAVPKVILPLFRYLCELLSLIDALVVQEFFVYSIFRCSLIFMNLSIR